MWECWFGFFTVVLKLSFHWAVNIDSNCLSWIEECFVQWCWPLWRLYGIENMSKMYWWSDTEWWKLQYPEKHLFLCQFAYHRYECVILWVNMCQHFISLWVTSQKWVAVLFWVNKTVGMILEHVCLVSLLETLKCYVCFTD